MTLFCIIDQQEIKPFTLRHLIGQVVDQQKNHAFKFFLKIGGKEIKPTARR